MDDPRGDVGLVRSIEGGAVRGVTRHGIDSWRAIPYAAPPIGALRPRAPAAVVPWAGVRDASRFGTISAQLHRNGRSGAQSVHGSGEDCLTVNVHAPAGRTSTTPGLPVMVFIHGGGYSAGAGRDFSPQGHSLVLAGQVIYVSFNYRLGPLGYLDFSRYSTPDRPFDGNLGLRDQVAVLGWVHRNIASFGGDPSNATIFGELAGANAVTTLMATPSAKGLFVGAIARSAPPGAVYESATVAQWAGDFVEILASRVHASIQREGERPARDGGCVEPVACFVDPSGAGTGFVSRNVLPRPCRGRGVSARASDERVCIRSGPPGSAHHRHQ
jgi:para-nitrobenzyl esterase